MRFCTPPPRHLPKAKSRPSTSSHASLARAAKRAGEETPRLSGRSIALIFEKTSTRTRCAFEVAAFDQGARVTYLDPSGSQIGHKESMEDTARVLGRMYDGIEYRGSAQTNVETLAAYAGVPVWNGLTDEWHPTQMLCDMLTMREHSGKHDRDIAFAYLGGITSIRQLAGVKRVVVVMEHTSKDGTPKFKPRCELPLTGMNVVDVIITVLNPLSTIRDS